MKNKGLDIGCAVGRRSYELAVEFKQVIGLDFICRLIDVGYRLKELGFLGWNVCVDGRWLFIFFVLVDVLFVFLMVFIEDVIYILVCIFVMEKLVFLIFAICRRHRMNDFCVYGNFFFVC